MKINEDIATAIANLEFGECLFFSRGDNWNRRSWQISHQTTFGGTGNLCVRQVLWGSGGSGIYLSKSEMGAFISSEFSRKERAGDWFKWDDATEVNFDKLTLADSEIAARNPRLK